MARRKQVDEAVSDVSEGALETFAPSAVELGALADEVRSFLDRKEELAQKLAHEIETTEKRLAELKRTAAALFPGGFGDETPERVERKPKKAKAIKLAAEEPAPEEPAPVPGPAPVESPPPEQDEAPRLEVETPAAAVTTEAPAPSGESESLAQVA